VALEGHRAALVDECAGRRKSPSAALHWSGTIPPAPVGHGRALGPHPDQARHVGGSGRTCPAPGEVP
jgi:hypothetical protein